MSKITRRETLTRGGKVIATDAERLAGRAI